MFSFFNHNSDLTLSAQMKSNWTISNVDYILSNFTMSNFQKMLLLMKHNKRITFRFMQLMPKL